MPLPKLNVGTHTLKLPSSGKEIEYRPFLVKEEKILMTAMESGETADMIRALRQIIDSCVENDLSTMDMPMFDIEYIFLQLRAKSVGEKIPISYSIENETCEKLMNGDCLYHVEIDVNEITVEKNPEHKDIIDLTKDIKIKMKYPQIEASASIAGLEGEKLVEKPFEMIGQCIEYILEGEEMHQTKDYSKKEIDEFLNSLSSGQFRSIQSFFDTMPKLKKEVTAECPSCGKKNTRTLEGIADFFVSG